MRNGRSVAVWRGPWCRNQAGGRAAAYTAEFKEVGLTGLDGHLEQRGFADLGLPSTR